MAEEGIKTEELPTEPATEPEVAPEAKAEAPEDELGALMAELEKAGVSNVEQLAGKLEASQQVGQMANLLGDARTRIQQLEANPTGASPAQEPNGEESVDLEQLMNTVLDKRDQKKAGMAAKARQLSEATWHAIRSDEDYSLVKEVWEAKLADPAFVMKMRSGGSTPVDEYTKTVRGYYKGISKQALDTITRLQKGGAVLPPHVEGEAGVPSMQGKESPDKAGLKKLQGDVDKGRLLTEQEELDALDGFMASPE